MDNFYETLGVQSSASQEEIKKAFKSAAMKHHPDRGGDETTFKRVNHAYETLGDSSKRAQYDAMQAGGFSQFNTTNINFEDIFNGHHPFGDIFGNFRQRNNRAPRNHDVNIRCQISLLESYMGKEVEATFQLFNKQHTVNITIPQGVSHGETIRYNGLGDDTIPNIPRGNLNLTVLVLPDTNFVRHGDDIYTEIEINPIEAILGTNKEVKTIVDKTILLKVQPGVETGTKLAVPGHGFKNPHNNQIGRFVCIVKIKTPRITDAELINKLQVLNLELNSHLGKING